MNLMDRRDSIIKAFAGYYYGHLVPLSFCGSGGGWSDWANLVRRFSESLQHPKNRLKYNMQQEIESLQNGMVEFSKNIHTSRFFPVVPHFREKFFYKFKNLCVELSWTISTKLASFLLGDCVEKNDSMVPLINEQDAPLEQEVRIKNVHSEYLFKTYEILSGKIG